MTREKRESKTSRSREDLIRENDRLRRQLAELEREKGRLRRDLSSNGDMEIALRQKEELLDTIVNTIPDIICLKDGRGRWLLANDYDLKLFDLEEVDYKGKTDAELAPFSDFYHDVFLACMDSDEMAWARGVPSRGEEVIPRPDGSARIFDIVKIPLFNPDGSRLALVVAGRDMTEHMRLQKHLREGEDFYRMLIETTPEGYLRISPYLLVTDMNSALGEMLGYEREEMLGRSPLDFVHAGERALFEKLVTTRTPRRKNHEIRLLKRNGDLLYTLCSPTILPEKEGAGQGAFVFFADISERKKVHQLEKENQKRFRLLFQNAPFPYQSLDAGGILIDVNRKWLRILGYGRKEVLGRPFADFLAPASLEGFQKSFEVLKRKGSVQNVEFEMIKKDGSSLQVSFDGRVLLDRKGAVLQTQCVFRDVTRRKKLDRMLKHSHKMLEEEVLKRTEELRQKSEEQEKILLELQRKSHELQESNIALKVLLEQSSKSRRDLDEKIGANIKELLLPYLDELDLQLAGNKASAYVEILRRNITKITSEFSRTLSSKMIGLTPRELQVADLIKQGRSNKEIAGLLQLSPGTVGVYRNNIRKKLGITSKKINLRSYLLTRE